MTTTEASQEKLSQDLALAEYSLERAEAQVREYLFARRPRLMKWAIQERDSWAKEVERLKAEIAQAKACQSDAIATTHIEIIGGINYYRAFFGLLVELSHEQIAVWNDRFNDEIEAPYSIAVGFENDGECTRAMFAWGVKKSDGPYWEVYDCHDADGVGGEPDYRVRWLLDFMEVGDLLPSIADEMIWDWHDQASNYQF
jgi:hypothetical protein